MDASLVVGDGPGRSLVVSLLGSLGEVDESRVAFVVADEGAEPRQLDEPAARRLAAFAESGGTVYAEFVTDPIGLFPRVLGPVRTAGFERIYVPPGADGHPVVDGFEP